jgi:hypothetical protein
MPPSNFFIALQFNSIPVQTELTNTYLWLLLPHHHGILADVSSLPRLAAAHSVRSSAPERPPIRVAFIERFRGCITPAAQATAARSCDRRSAVLRPRWAHARTHPWASLNAIQCFLVRLVISSSSHTSSLPWRPGLVESAQKEILLLSSSALQQPRCGTFCMCFVDFKK